MKLIAPIFILILLLSSCSKKSIESTGEVQKFLPKSAEYDNIQFRARFKPDLPDANQSFTIDVSICKNDSIYLTAIGPFGISLGRLYADNDRFLFYNTFENIAFKGEPSADNLRKVSGINVSFAELIRIVRYEFNPVSDYKFENSDDNYSIFKNKNNSNEQLFLNNTTKNIEMIEYSDDTRNTSYKVDYSNFNYYDKIKYPSLIKVILDDNQGNMKIEIKSVEFNPDVNFPFSFEIPKNIQVIDLDEDIN